MRDSVTMKQTYPKSYDKMIIFFFLKKVSLIKPKPTRYFRGLGSDSSIFHKSKKPIPMPIGPILILSFGF